MKYHLSLHTSGHFSAISLCFPPKPLHTSLGAFCFHSAPNILHPNTYRTTASPDPGPRPPWPGLSSRPLLRAHIHAVPLSLPYFAPL